MSTVHTNDTITVCFTLKCCMAAVVNVKIKATECRVANTCQSLKSSVLCLIEELCINQTGCPFVAKPQRSAVEI